MSYQNQIEHFKTIFWKCYLIEVGADNGLKISLGVIVGMGMMFSSAVSILKNPEYTGFVMSICMFFMCGMMGKMVATNLVRDRMIKFRLTLQLVGVHQSAYLAANMIFALMWGVLQVILLVISLLFFGMIFIPAQYQGTIMTIEVMLPIFMNTSLFLMAFVAMCAAFSAVIRQYEYASEIIGKFSFLCIFLPIAYAVSTFVRAMNLISKA